MIAVIGSHGQLASELRAFPGVCTFGRDKIDLEVPSLCGDFLSDLKPSAVINAAAFTDVEAAETDEARAHKINCEAPEQIAIACAGLGVPLLHISTDYVFDGRASWPYLPTDDQQPINAYGRTKKAGENAVTAAGGNSIILRTSWLFSQHGKNFVTTMLKLHREEKKLSVVFDQIGCPTSAMSLAASCLKIVEAQLSQQVSGGTFHFCGSPAVSWFDFAVEVFRQCRRQVEIIPIRSLDLTTVAKRPLNTSLDCKKTFEAFGIEQPSWKNDLNLILNQLGELSE